MWRLYFLDRFAPFLNADDGAGTGGGTDDGDQRDEELDDGSDDGGTDDGDDSDGDEEDEEDKGDKGAESDDDDGVIELDDKILEDYVPKARVNQIVSERVNKLNEKLKKADSAVSVLDTISTLTGVAVDQIAGQLQEAAAATVAKNKNISIEAARAEVARQIKAVDDEKLSKRLEYEKQEIQMLKKTKDFPLYDAYAEDIKDTAEEKGISLEDAYVLVTARKSKVADNYKKQSKEKDRMTEINRKIGPKGAGAPKGTQPAILKSIDKKAADGMTEKDILDYADESTAYDNMISRQKKGGK